MNINVIDEHNYPSNIAVFRAATFSEAVCLLKKAIKPKHIQGAVWLKNKNTSELAPLKSAAITLTQNTDCDGLGFALNEEGQDNNINSLSKEKQQAITEATADLVPLTKTFSNVSGVFKHAYTKHAPSFTKNYDRDC